MFNIEWTSVNISGKLIKQPIKLQQLVAPERIIFSFYLNFSVFRVNVIENTTRKFCLHERLIYFITTIFSKQNVGCLCFRY